MRIFLIILFGVGLLTAKTLHYEIDLWGIHVADVEMETSDTLFENIPSKVILFTTKTTPFTSKLFRVNNHYKTIVSKIDNRVLYFSKSTFQPGVENKISTQLIGGNICYTNSDICIPDSTFNIFSFLEYLCHFAEKGSQNKFLIEREGLLYNANYKCQNIDNSTTLIELKMTQKNNVSQYQVFEHTDIFTWAIFKENTTKNIWMNTELNEILRCEFKSGLVRLTAKKTVKNE
ncbi:MAG: DUF3108 domain-containing protein [Candidatus Marinimicrobia bacterium]|nr:DUF3108 domain-containing protein [Candidatus Neomarinimicrobiota bacterium]MBL7023165.1 DUF3108 domain-containing protein [Candidatus Neomarinimicrobiota bacterium]MBL7109027.1 DUF3108 domain-containing protein [Candidatus Neomarinimicrobiota bacterium]